MSRVTFKLPPWTRFDFEELADGALDALGVSLHAGRFQELRPSQLDGGGWVSPTDLLDAEGVKSPSTWWNAPLVVLGYRFDRRRIPAPVFKARLAKAMADYTGFRRRGKVPKHDRARIRDDVRAELLAATSPSSTTVPVVWDAHSGSVLVGSTSPKVVERIEKLWRQTVGDGQRNLRFRGRVAHLDDATQKALALSPATLTGDSLHELLLWLWHGGQVGAPDVKAGEKVVSWTIGDGVGLRPRASSRSTALVLRGRDAGERAELRAAVAAGRTLCTLALTLRVNGIRIYRVTVDGNGLKLAAISTPAAKGRWSDLHGAVADAFGCAQELDEALDALVSTWATLRTSDRWGQWLASSRSWLGDELRRIFLDESTGQFRLFRAKESDTEVDTDSPAVEEQPKERTSKRRRKDVEPNGVHA